MNVRSGMIAVLLLFASAAAGFVAGERIAPARYTMANVGKGSVMRMNTRTGEVALFNADCLASLPPPPAGSVVESCPAAS